MPSLAEVYKQYYQETAPYVFSDHLAHRTFISQDGDLLGFDLKQLLDSSLTNRLYRFLGKPLPASQKLAKYVGYLVAKMHALEFTEIAMTKVMTSLAIFLQATPQYQFLFKVLEPYKQMIDKEHMKEFIHDAGINNPRLVAA